MTSWQIALLILVTALLAKTGAAHAAANDSPLTDDPLAAVAVSRNWETHQLTTFNPETRSKTLYVGRGDRVTIGEVRGEGHIANIWLTFPGWFWQHWNTNAPISQTILKTLILRIYWDDAEHPAIEAPMGDFFGAGLCRATSFASTYFGMSSGGFFCKFPMPFREGFRIEIENRDKTIDTGVFMNVLYQLNSGLSKSSGYFHAQFRTGRMQGSEPAFIGEFHGRGHYVGCTLAVQSEPLNTLSCLEAPEYVYVDKDWETARIHGTGLEDYFLGGWYFREGPFAGPLHGVPIKDTLRSSVAMYRVHESDAIHFKRRFRMEFVNPWEPERLVPYAYSSVAFCYLDSPEGMDIPLPGAEQLLVWYRIPDSDHQSIP